MKNILIATAMTLMITPAAQAANLELITSHSDYSGRGFSFSDWPTWPTPPVDELGQIYDYIAGPYGPQPQPVSMDGLNLSFNDLNGGKGALFWYDGDDFGSDRKIIGMGQYQSPHVPYATFDILGTAPVTELGFNMFTIGDWNDFVSNPISSTFTFSALGANGEILGSVDVSQFTPLEDVFRGIRFDDGTEFYGLQIKGYTSLAILETPAGMAGGGVGAVPEAATWAMMIMGFGLVGSALRSQRRKGATLAA